MCMSNNAGTEVTFKDTILFAREYLNAAGQIEHLLGYFNKVHARDRSNDGMLGLVRGSRGAVRGRDDDFGWDLPQHVSQENAPVLVDRPGNAMLFAVPALPGTMTAQSLIPVGDYPNFMKDLKVAVQPRRPLSRGGKSDGLLSFGTRAVVVHGFDQGTYDVVIAGSAAAIASVIPEVAKEKRPVINDDLYSELDRLYPTWTFVLFCFGESTAEKAGCALMTYRPQREDILYLPGLDGHTGKVEWNSVALDHTLVVGSHLLATGGDVREVHFTDPGFAKAHPEVGNRVIGKSVSGTAPQGDFLCSIADVRNGNFRCKRQLPPGTPAHIKAAQAGAHYI